MAKKPLTANEVRERLRAACNGDQQGWAAEHLFSPPYISDVLNGRREPAERILAALGLKKTVIYEELS